MSVKVKVAAIQLMKDPTVRVVLILGSLIIAALVGGAPNDTGY